MQPIQRYYLLLLSNKLFPQQPTAFLKCKAQNWRENTSWSITRGEHNCMILPYVSYLLIHLCIMFVLSLLCDIIGLCCSTIIPRCSENLLSTLLLFTVDLWRCLLFISMTSWACPCWISSFFFKTVFLFFFFTYICASAILLHFIFLCP